MAQFHHQTDADPTYIQPNDEKEAELLKMAGRAPTAAEIDNFCRVLHYPGQVQPHGVFVLLEHPKECKILAVSKNSHMIFSAQFSELLGENFLQLFDDSEKIRSALESEDCRAANPVVATVKKSGAIVNLVLSKSPNGIGVDVIELDPTENFLTTTGLITAGIQDFDLWSSVKDLSHQVVNTMFAATGYDKVVCWQFADDGEGLVVAERRSLRPSPLWQGVTWLATDLPTPARDHLLKVRSGNIVDATADRVDIATCGDLSLEDIKLQNSILRRRHKALEYQLGQWGCCSLSTFSVVVEGKLWGLICGFHTTPKSFCYQTQVALESLVQAFAVRLSQMANESRVSESVEALQVSTQIFDRIRSEASMERKLQTVADGVPNLCHLIPGCKGAAVHHDGKLFSVGIVPSESSMQKVVEVFNKRWSGTGCRKTEVVRSLKQLDKSLSGIAKVASGALCLPLLDDSMVLIFREESGELVTYAGNPEHTATFDHATGHMYNKNSYDHFEITLTGVSAKWLPEHVQAVEDFVAALRPVLTQDHTLYQELNAFSQPVFCVNSEGKIIFWSHSLSNVTGISIDQAEGRILKDMATDDSRQAIQDLTRAGGPSRKETSRSICLLNPENGSSSKLVALAFGRENGDICCACKSTTFADEAFVRQQMLDCKVRRIAEDSKFFRPNNIIVRDRNLEGPGGGFIETEWSFKYYPDSEDSKDSILSEDDFGKTYRMVNIVDSAQYSCKKIKMVKAQKLGVSLQDLRHDCNQLMKLSLPQVSTVRECFLAAQGKTFCVVTDVNDEDQSLSELLHGEKQGLSVGRCTDLAMSLANVLLGIHSRGFMHLGISEENFVANEETNAIKLLNIQLPCLAVKAKPGFCSSPEMVQSRSLSKAEDLWAAGCLLTMMLIGFEQFKAMAPGGLAKNLSTLPQIVRECNAKSVSLTSVMEGLLQADPANRMSAQEMVSRLGAMLGANSQAA